MQHKISANEALLKRYLVVDEQGVEYCETAFIGGKRRFRFGEIDCVLLSPKGLLSLQVGAEIFSVPTRRADKGHQGLIEALVGALKQGA
jgi:hypothetical protein